LNEIQLVNSLKMEESNKAKPVFRVGMTNRSAW
jgi:hypothetical protein